jgi:hypothetical protein
MTSSELLRRPEAVQLIFLTYKNQQLKNVLCWLGVVLCRREKDEYHFSCCRAEGRLARVVVIYFFSAFLRAFGGC